jgi:hypothetical protein
MSRIGLFFLFCTMATAVRGQQLPDGLWNAGRSFSIESEQLVPEKQITLVHLWPGFAVVKNQYSFRHEGNDSLKARFHWPDTATTPHPLLGSLHNLPSSGKRVLMDNDTLLPVKDASGLHWEIVLAPGGAAEITTYEVCPTSQAKRALGGGLKEQNGLIVSNGKGVARQVLIELKGGLRQIDLTGVYPQDVLGSRERLLWNDTAAGRDLLIWYQGAPPDFKFEKKVEPKQALLFAEMDKFQLGAFAEETFEPLNKTDYSAHEPGGVTSVLYFILFSIPWLLLIAFIIFLLKKPKKQTQI